MDDFCFENNIIPEIIKIDVEGAEVNVLKGAKKLLMKHRPEIVLSVHPRHLKMLGSSVEELVKLIKSYRYQIRDMQGEATEKMEFAEYILAPDA